MTLKYWDLKDGRNDPREWERRQMLLEAGENLRPEKLNSVTTESLFLLGQRTCG